MARIRIPEGEGGDAVQVWSLQPEMGKAVARFSHAAYHQSQLPVREREAARMRIAQLNQCKVCLNFRAESVVAQGITEDFYAHVSTAHTDERYSERERLAVDFAERFAIDHTNLDDEFFARLHEHFDDAEILDLTICVAAFLGLGRMMRVLGIDETTLADV